MPVSALLLLHALADAYPVLFSGSNPSIVCSVVEGLTFSRVMGTSARPLFKPARPFVKAASHHY